MNIVEIVIAAFFAIVIACCVVKIIKRTKFEDECDEETPEWYPHEVESEDGYIASAEDGPLDFDKAYVELEQNDNDEVSDKKVKKPRTRSKKTTKKTE